MPKSVVPGQLGRRSGNVEDDGGADEVPDQDGEKDDHRGSHQASIGFMAVQ